MAQICMYEENEAVSDTSKNDEQELMQTKSKQEVATAVKYFLVKQNNSTKAVRCKVPETAPKNIEKVINSCQDEIKYAILAEAFESVNLKDIHLSKSRRRRSLFNEDEKRIAGCLLLCVYRRTNSLNEVGFPTLDGLVHLYAEGVTDKNYVLATIQAVHTCLNIAQNKHITTPQSLQETGKTCDIAYDVFDCVSDKIAEFCGQTP